MNKKEEQIVYTHQDTNSNYTIKSLEDVIQEQLTNIKEQLKNTNIDVSDIKQKVAEIDLNLKIEKYKTQVNNFLKEHPEGWQLRIIKANDIKSMSYYPCITYIKDENFHHIKIKAQYTEEETALEIRVNIREYKPNQFLIKLDINKGCDCTGKIFYVNRYIVYNSEIHKAEEIVNPLKALIDLKPYLEQLGYPIPKRYLRKVKNGTPFNWANAAPVIREYWHARKYMNEKDLEELRP